MKTPNEQAIADIIAEIGINTPVTNADWGRLFADAMLEKGSEDAIYGALSDAGEMYRSKALSEAKNAARKAVDRVIKHGGKNGTVAAAAERQLAFPCGFEGVSPRPLIDTDHAFLLATAAYIRRKKLGIEANLIFVERAARLTQPYPGRTVGELIRSGFLRAEQFASDEEATA